MILCKDTGHQIIIKKFKNELVTGHRSFCAHHLASPVKSSATSSVSTCHMRCLHNCPKGIVATKREANPSVGLLVGGLAAASQAPKGIHDGLGTGASRNRLTKKHIAWIFVINLLLSLEIILPCYILLPWNAYVCLLFSWRTARKACSLVLSSRLSCWV